MIREKLSALFGKNKEKKEELNSIGVYEKAAASDWKPLLESQGFDGDLERGSALVQAFARGGKDMLIAVSKRGRLPDTYSAAVFVPLKGQGPTEHILEFEQTATGKKISRKVIRLDLENIEALLKFDDASVLAMHDPEDNETFLSVGTPEDIMYLAGMEEVGHDIYYATRPLDGSADSEMNRSTEYATKSVVHDAANSEYHGLGWSVRTLLDSQQNQVTTKSKIVAKNIQLLKARLQRAAQLRKQIRES